MGGMCVERLWKPQTKKQEQTAACLYSNFDFIQSYLMHIVEDTWYNKKILTKLFDKNWTIWWMVVITFKTKYSFTSVISILVLSHWYRNEKNKISVALDCLNYFLYGRQTKQTDVYKTCMGCRYKRKHQYPEWVKERMREGKNNELGCRFCHLLWNVLQWPPYKQWNNVHRNTITAWK